MSQARASQRPRSNPYRSGVPTTVYRICSTRWPAAADSTLKLNVKSKQTRRSFFIDFLGHGVVREGEETFQCVIEGEANVPVPRIKICCIASVAEARQLLVYSVTVHPHVEGWHNLAVVHRRIGETDLAERAEAERLQLAQKAVKSAPGIGDTVRWVDPKTFAAGSSHDVQSPADQRYAVAPAAASTPTRR